MHRLRTRHKRELRSLGDVQRRSDCDYKERRDGKVNGSCWTEKIIAQKFHRALPQLTLPCKSSARRTRQPSEDWQDITPEDRFPYAIGGGGRFPRAWQNNLATVPNPRLAKGQTPIERHAPSPVRS